MYIIPVTCLNETTIDTILGLRKAASEVTKLIRLEASCCLRSAKSGLVIHSISISNYQEQYQQVMLTIPYVASGDTVTLICHYRNGCVLSHYRITVPR